MVPKEVLKSIRRIEIKTKYLVESLFAGGYRSIFKGRGLEFAGIREYVRGDDYRIIDWKVTARQARPHVKQFLEEREMVVMIMMDISGSADFGSIARTKRQLAAEVAAVLAFSATASNDRVGLMMFTDEVEKYVAPGKGRTHALRIIRDILYERPRRRGTGIAGALRYLTRVQRHRCVAFLISDFMDEGYEKILRVASRHHDIIALILDDEREREIPDAGLIDIVDSETGEEALVDTSDPAIRERFRALALERREKLMDSLRSMNVDIVHLDTAKSFIEPLMSFFAMRERRARVRA